MQRGRKSTESLSTVVSLVPGQPPPLPAELTPEQSITWRAIVGQMPADFFTHGASPLLVVLCRHVSISRTVAGMLAAIEPLSLTDDKTLDRFETLTKMHEREGRAISSLMTRLRLTPHSRYAARGAHTAAQSTPRNKPWEVDD
jgi:hypothetical protein